MARWIVAGLIVVNVLLGMGVYLRLGGEQTAKAQIGRAGADIATVAGQANNMSVVYILDVNSGALVALQNQGANGVRVMAQRNVAADIKRIK